MASSEEEKISEIFGVLEETGAIELLGLNDDGEPVYRITEKCKDVFPEFYDMYRQEISDTAAYLWKLGIVEVRFNPDTSVSIYFTASNYTNYKKHKADLTEEHIFFLDAVIGSSLRNLDRRL